MLDGYRDMRIKAPAGGLEVDTPKGLCGEPNRAAKPGRRYGPPAA